MFFLRSFSLRCAVFSLGAVAVAAGCVGAEVEPSGTGETPVIPNDATTSDANVPEAALPTDGGDAATPLDGATPDADAAPLDGGNPGTCNLPAAYVPTLADPVTNKGVVIYGPGGPSSGVYFRVTTVSHANVMKPSESFLYLESGDVVGGPSNTITPTGFKKIGGCTWSSNLVSCAAGAYHSLFGNGRAGSDFRLVALTQTHNPKYGYGVFNLVQVDPKNGATTREGRVMTTSGPAVVFASAIASSGDDVTVVGDSNVAFAGESGAGKYFRMKYAGFLAPACDGAVVQPTEIVRDAAPLTP